MALFLLDIAPFLAYICHMIVQGDCLDVMKTMDDESVDCVVTDPPYNIGKNYGNDSDLQNASDYEEWLSQVGSEIMRLATPEAWIAVFNGADRIKTTIDAFGAENHVWTACWYAPNKRHRSVYGFSLWQPIVLFRKSGREWLKLRDFYSYTTGSEHYDHPTPKPYGLIRHLVSDFSHEGDLVLDPFLGSGTTAVAASELDRRFVGIELNADYVAVAEKRMSEETNQIRLFRKDRNQVLT